MSIEIEITPIRMFLMVYFYELENNLNKIENGLNLVKFQSEEANTDEYIKKYFKEYILKNNNINHIELDSILININDKDYTSKIDDLKKIKIINVLLPNELKDRHKSLIKKDNVVYTDPDLLLEINDGNSSYFESVELKSAKKNVIPGSSVQQVLPYEWVIFLQRNKYKTNVSTGYYINCLTEKLPFPDRSPRPQIGFENLLDWNKSNRKVEDNILIIDNSSGLFDNKIVLMQDWQEHLALEWINLVKSKELLKNEKWFNNALRKFSLKLLYYNKKLSKKEKKEFYNSIEDLIK